MPVNLDKPLNWNADVALSVDMYNQWFMDFAPQAFRETRVTATQSVEEALANTENLTNIRPDTLRQWPGVLPTLRMSTCPPLAVDRLIGLAGVSASTVKNLEQNRLPARMHQAALDRELTMIGDIIERLADPDIFVWINREAPATETEIHRAATIVADRLCGSVANPIIRNAQERRQLAYIAQWLEARGYERIPEEYIGTFRDMPPGTFSFRMNVPVGGDDSGNNTINIPVDAVIMRQTAQPGEFPLLVEAKSAGDFTNTNKRRKEEAQKIRQLRDTYGNDVQFILFLCGYFDSGYLGYEAAEGIDWVWEHRIDDLEQFEL